MNDELLPILKWAREVAWDLGIEDELYNSDITCDFPNEYSVKLMLTIRQARIYKNEFGRTVLTLIADSRSKSDNDKYIIRIYSPTMPKILSLDDLIGRKIIAIKAIASVSDRESDFTTVIAHSIKTTHNLKKNTLNAIIKTQDEDEKSDLFDNILSGDQMLIIGKQSDKLKRSVTKTGQDIKDMWFPYVKSHN